MPPLLLVRLRLLCHVRGIGPLPNDKRAEIVVRLVSWLVFRLLFRQGLDHQLLDLQLGCQPNEVCLLLR